MTLPGDTLIHITDLHFWKIVKNPFALMNKRFLGNANVIYRRCREFHMDRTDPYSDYVAGLGIGTCLIGGDFTSTATPAEYRLGRDFVEGLVRRGIQVYAMPGNHDVYTFESVRARRFEAYFGAHVPDGGYPALIRLSGGTPLLVAPTVCPNVLSAAGRISDREVGAVRALLETCPEGPVLVAGHYPILHRTAGYTSGRSRQLRNAESLRAALGESGREILYIAGHVHRFSYTQDRRYPNLRHLTTGAFFLKRPREACRGALSTISTEGGAFRVSWHTFETRWEITEPEIMPQE